jgi:hypothetical protein
VLLGTPEIEEGLTWDGIGIPHLLTAGSEAPYAVLTEGDTSMADNSGTTSRGPRKSSPSSLAAWERAMKVASKMRPDQETFPGKAPKLFPVGRLREAMHKAGTVAKG